jgi:hypothetical protein
MAFRLKSRLLRCGSISMARKIAALGRILVAGEEPETVVLEEYELAKCKKVPKNPMATYNTWRGEVTRAVLAGDAKMLEACQAEGIDDEGPERPKAKRKPRATKIVNA